MDDNEDRALKDEVWGVGDDVHPPPPVFNVCIAVDDF